MKNIIWIFFLGLIACNSEEALDCFQTSGGIVQRHFNLPSFTKIRIEDDVSLVVRQGDTQEVIIETGQNLLNDVSVNVVDNTLVIQDNNRCNFVRDFGITKALITVLDLKEIRNASEFDVMSEGPLHFPTLNLVSNTSGNIDNVRKSGDFFLELYCNNLTINANGSSAFYLEGFSNKASYMFRDEIPVIIAPNLLVNDLTVFQRSSNKMIVHPIKSIKGVIRGVGDIISVNRPPIVEVQEFFTGKLIFQN